MMNNFNRDRANAREAELIVFSAFGKLTNKYKFEDVADDKQYYYKGDIKAIAPDGREIFIEVKDDSRIAETRNILCEEEVYFKELGYF